MRYRHERGVKRPICKDDPVLQQEERKSRRRRRPFACCLPAATDDPIRSESTQRDALVSRRKTHPSRYFVLRKYPVRTYRYAYYIRPPVHKRAPATRLDSTYRSELVEKEWPLFRPPSPTYLCRRVKQSGWRPLNQMQQSSASCCWNERTRQSSMTPLTILPFRA
jgi:hypothetical protein